MFAVGTTDERDALAGVALHRVSFAVRWLYVVLVDNRRMADVIVDVGFVRSEFEAPDVLQEEDRHNHGHRGRETGVSVVKHFRRSYSASSKTKNGQSHRWVTKHGGELRQKKAELNWPQEDVTPTSFKELRNSLNELHKILASQMYPKLISFFITIITQKNRIFLIRTYSLKTQFQNYSTSNILERKKTE